MHTSTGMVDKELSLVEAQSLLRGKFLRISLKGNDYCFKVNAVKEIITSISVLKREKEPGFVADNLCGSIRLRHTAMPVFDLRAPAELLTHTSEENCFIIIIEAIANGLIIQIGILTNKMNAVVQHAMTEMSEDIVHSRLRGTMPFKAARMQTCCK